MRNIYFRLAKTNMSNNKPLYIPYILSGLFTVAMFYMMLFLNNNPGISSIPGAVVLQSILATGSVVIGIFAYIFLFYTNSFIIKRRKKEIGVYNILGMEKRHIGRVLALETVFVALISIGGGLFTGILFSKLMLMILYKILGFKESIAFSVTMDGIKITCILFCILYLLLLLYNRMQIHLSNPIQLLHGSNMGEKEPKTKILMTLAGVACIGAGYYIAITTKNPVQVISLFFVAVILVIIGTFFLFTAGSIALLKLLRKNKKYYYNKRHFSAVSGMLYRMKQNAAGLASICVLSTMVLVMISTTVCMFAGINDELICRYPSELNFTLHGKHIQDIPDSLEEEVTSFIQDQGRTVTNRTSYSYFYMYMTKDASGTAFEGENSHSFMPGMTNINIITKENLLAMDDSIDIRPLDDLPSGSVAIYGNSYSADSITILGDTYPVYKSIKFVSKQDQSVTAMFDGIYYVVVDSAKTENAIYEKQKNLYPDAGFDYVFNLGIDTDGTKQEKETCANAVKEFFAQYNSDNTSGYMESRAANEQEFYTLYGGLFFLGVFLGAMFLMVTVLIIFYKQISEGYDDKQRFEIMEKVGMSNDEVKATIRSQVRIVFFLPILTASIHVLAAYPMIRRMLLLLNLTNNQLFVNCLILTILIFTVIYYIVFKLTSKAYYNIVGNPM